MEIVSLKMSAVFDDGYGRLFPSELPCTMVPMMIPACPTCLAPALDEKCEHCGLQYCSLCMTSHTCQYNVKTPENTPRTIIESCENGDSGSTEELKVTILPGLYEKLRGEEDRIAIDIGILAKIEVALGEICIQDEVVGRYFGTSIDSLPEFHPYIYYLKNVLS